MSKVTCPYCFESFDSADVHFLCRCKKVDDEKYKNFWRPTPVNPQGLPIIPKRGIFSFGTPKSAVCPECKRKTHMMLCPKCHNRIPNDMVLNGGKIISIVGARSSGKSNYIAVLIEELRRNVNRLGRLGLEYKNVAEQSELQTERRYKEDFYNPLYNNSKCVDQTAVGDFRSRIPMIFTLTSPKGDTMHLVFYDTAGENFGQTANIAENVKFLTKSDAILYLVDTENIDAVRKRLGKPKADTGFDSILSALLGHFQEGNEEAKAMFSKPMAVVFSKIDYITSGDERFQDCSIAGLKTNSPYLMSDGINLKEFEMNSKSLRSILDRVWQQPDFINNIDNNWKDADKNVCFFGVSSLGSAPKGTTLTGDVNPFRVLDPLVWILNKLNFPLPLKK